MSSISTHILDTALGMPAAGVDVTLARVDDQGAIEPIAQAETDTDGRVATLAPGEGLAAGDYWLSFDTAAYFESSNRESFYPRVDITFRIADAGQHYHVPLLISPFGYSTYRGS